MMWRIAVAVGLFWGIMQVACADETAVLNNPTQAVSLAKAVIDKLVKAAVRVGKDTTNIPGVKVVEDRRAA